jgi:hypothetical protein
MCIERPKSSPFWFGDIVFLKVCTDRYQGMITRAIVSPAGIIYMVTWEGGDKSNHFAMELSTTFERDWSVEANNEYDEES